MLLWLFFFFKSCSIDCFGCILWKSLMHCNGKNLSFSSLGYKLSDKNNEVCWKPPIEQVSGTLREECDMVLHCICAVCVKAQRVQALYVLPSCIYCMYCLLKTDAFPYLVFLYPSCYEIILKIIGRIKWLGTKLWNGMKFRAKGGCSVYSYILWYFQISKDYCEKHSRNFDITITVQVIYTGTFSTVYLTVGRRDTRSYVPTFAGSQYVNLVLQPLRYLSSNLC